MSGIILLHRNWVLEEDKRTPWMFLVPIVHAWLLVARFLQISTQFNFHCQVPHITRGPCICLPWKKVSRRIYSSNPRQRRLFAQDDARTILDRVWSDLRRTCPNHCSWLRCILGERGVIWYRLLNISMWTASRQLTFKISPRNQWSRT